jgi:hypothetical protein
MNRGKATIVIFLLVILMAVGWLIYRQAPWKENLSDKETSETFGKIEESFAKGEMDRVREYADLVLQRAQSVEDKAHALYFKAKSYQESAPKQAAECWREIIDKYSESKFASEARNALLKMTKSEDAGGATPAPETPKPKGAESAASPKPVAGKTPAEERAPTEVLGLIVASEKPGGNTEQVRSRLSNLLKGEPVPGLQRQIIEALSRLNREALFEPRENEYHALYKVRQGDVPLRIAEGADTTHFLLQVLNPRMGTLQIGQNLVVPKKGGIRIEIDRSERALDVYSEMAGTEGRFLVRYPIGLPVSEPRKEEGEYFVGRNKKTYEPKASGEYGTLGSRRIALMRGAVDGAESTVSIHGTNRPEALAEESTTNSIRMRNQDVEALFMLYRVGTPVTIRD